MSYEEEDTRLTCGGRMVCGVCQAHGRVCPGAGRRSRHGKSVAVTCSRKD